MVQALIVLAAAAVTALATGLGALPLTFRRVRGDAFLGISNALAAGVMLGASASLIIEAADRGASGVVLGAALGGLFVTPCSGLLGRVGEPDLGAL